MVEDNVKDKVVGKVEDKVEEIDTVGLIEKANLAAARLEEGNKRMAQLLQQQERLNVERKLGGESFAGKSQKVDPEQLAIESASKLLEGTGYENILKDKENAK